MKNLLTAANTNYWLGPAPQQLHQEVLDWLSDLEFYKTEIAFLTRLLDIAFLRITSQQNLTELNLLEERVGAFREKDLDQLFRKIVLHEKHLSDLDEDQFKKNKTQVDEEHRDRYAEFIVFAEEIKKIKKEIFALVESQMKRTRQASIDFENGKSIF